MVVGLLASVLILAFGYPRRAGNSPSALSACPFCALLPWESVRGRSQRARRLAPSPPSLLHLFLQAGNLATAAWTSEQNKTSEFLEKKHHERRPQLTLWPPAPDTLPLLFLATEPRPRRRRCSAIPSLQKGNTQRTNCRPMMCTDIEGTESEMGVAARRNRPLSRARSFLSSAVPVLQRT